MFTIGKGWKSSQCEYSEWVGASTIHTLLLHRMDTCLLCMFQCMNEHTHTLHMSGFFILSCKHITVWYYSKNDFNSQKAKEQLLYNMRKQFNIRVGDFCTKKCSSLVVVERVGWTNRSTEITKINKATRLSYLVLCVGDLWHIDQWFCCCYNFVGRVQRHVKRKTEKTLTFYWINDPCHINNFVFSHSIDYKINIKWHRI